MSFLLLAAVSLLPGLAWVWYFYRQDRAEPEPRWLIIRMFVLGMVAVFPAALAEAPFRRWIIAPPDLLSLFAVTVLVIGLVEETAKFAALYFGAYRQADFNEVMDGLVYGITTGLGFAALENLFYAASFGVQVAPARAVITCLAHATFSGLAGYYLGLAKMGFGPPKVLIWTGLLVAILFHGSYDFFILARRSFLGVPGIVISIILLFGAYTLLHVSIRRARVISPFRRSAGGEEPDRDDSDA